MGKKSKKSHHKSQSSSEEDDAEESRGSSDTEHHKRKSRSIKEHSKESSGATLGTHVFPTTLERIRRIKKPVYRLEKNKATEQKSVNKEDERGESNKTYTSSHVRNGSRGATNDISWKCSSVSGRKTVESGSTKSLKSNNPVTSHWNTMKLNTQLTIPSLLCVAGDKQAKTFERKNDKSDRPTGTRNDNGGVRTKEPNQTCRDLKSRGAERCRLPEGSKFPATGKPSTAVRTSARCPIADKRTATSAGHKPVLKFTARPQRTSAKSPQDSQRSCPNAPALRHDFKIPKKLQPKTTGRHSPDADPARMKVLHKVKLSQPGQSSSRGGCSRQDGGRQALGCAGVTLGFPPEERDKRSFLSGFSPAGTDAAATNDRIQVTEELQLARSDRRLELDVMKSYGELTAMDIDPPEEGAADSLCKQLAQQELLVVLDTNILLSHLDYVKKIISHGLGALGLPIILIPWVVLQELDSLKKGRGLSGSVAHLAIPAISYIYNSLKSRQPRLWGQSMQQARKVMDGRSAENNDDRVLQCCLQYQSQYPGCALILCTNDKNLCSKALLSGVTALSKNDLEADAGRSAQQGFRPPQSIKPRLPPLANPQPSPPRPSAAQPRGPQRAERAEKDNHLGTSEVGDKAEWLSGCVSELEDCLRTVLSHVLEAEMKEAYDELWLEIVYKKPPWTLHDVLLCLKKHWIAVFGYVVPRNKLDTVLSLIDFFKSGTRTDCSTAVAAVREARELVDAFGERSNRVPSALSKLDTIQSKLQPQKATNNPTGCSPNPEGPKYAQGKSPDCDVVMNDEDDEEDKQPVPAQVSNQEVWALFENIWSKLSATSSDMFKALGFDHCPEQGARPAGGPPLLLPPPPPDALRCLHALSTLVSQLLQLFSSILSSSSSSEEVQALLSNLHTFEVVTVDSRFTAQDIHDCLSQQDHRERLSLGGNQLMDLKGALDRCVEALGFTHPL